MNQGLEKEKEMVGEYIGLEFRTVKGSLQEKRVGVERLEKLSTISLLNFKRNPVLIRLIGLFN